MAAEFKVRTDATTDSTDTHSVPVYFPYKDWYHHQGATVPLTGGKDAASLFITIPTPEKPNYGDAQLKGYELGVFVNYIEHQNTYSSPEYKVYKMTQPVVKEGTFGTLDTKDILVYTMRHDNAAYELENFTNAQEEIRKYEVSRSRYYSIPAREGYDNAEGFAFDGGDFYEVSYEKYTDRYVNDDGFVEIKKGKKAWTWLTRSDSDIYRPVITKPEWDDPYWLKDWVEDNAVTSAESTEMESSLMTLGGTIFDSMRNGNAIRHTSAEGELMDLEIDEVMFDTSGGPTSNTNARLFQKRTHGYPSYARSLMLHTTKIPTPLPYGRKKGSSSATTSDFLAPLPLQVTLNVNFQKLAPAYNIKGDLRDNQGGDILSSARDAMGGYYNSSLRGFFVVFANTPPETHEDYELYIKRLEANNQGDEYYWNAFAFMDVLSASTSSTTFRGDVGMLSYNIKCSSNIVNWNGYQDYKSTAAAIPKWWKLAENYTSDTFPLHELPTSSHPSWRKGIPKREWIKLNFVFPYGDSHHYGIVTNAKDEIIAIDRGACQGSNLNNEAMDLNHMSIWSTSAPNMAAQEAYITDNKLDIESDILIDSVVIRGASPTKTNATILENYLKNPINITGDISHEDTGSRLFNPAALEDGWTGASNTSQSQMRGYGGGLNAYFHNDEGSSNSTRHKVANYIAFGLKDNLSGSREILFNNFRCSSLSLNTAIDSGNIVAWKSINHATNNPLGHNVNKNTLIDNNITSKFTTNGTRLVDYFTKKGFVTVTSGDTTLEERECIMASTRVIEYKGGNKIVVEDLELLDCPPGEKYMVYLAGKDYSTGAYIKDLTILKRNTATNEVTLSKDLGSTDLQFEDTSGVTFTRTGNAAVRTFTSVDADSSLSYDGRYFVLYDGDNRRHLFYFSSTNTVPYGVGKVHSTTRVTYSVNQTIAVMCGNISTAIAGHSEFSATTSGLGDLTTVIATNAAAGACEVGALSTSPAFGAVITETTAGTTDANGDTIVDTGSGFGSFVDDQWIYIRGTSGANGWYKIKDATAGTLKVYTPNKGYIWSGTENTADRQSATARGINRRIKATETPSSYFKISSALLSNHYKMATGHKVYISPQRKWFGFEIFNCDSNNITLPDKSYDSVLIGSTAIASQTTGPTYNELMYTDDDGYKLKWDISQEQGSLLEWQAEYNKELKGISEDDDYDNYITKWKPFVVSAGQVASIASTTFTLNDAFSELQYNNYGKKVVLIDDGTHTGTTTTIDDVDISSALNKFSVASNTNWTAGDMYQISGYNRIKLDELVKTNDKYSEGELACFYLTSTDVADRNIVHIDTFNGSADNPPYLLTTYYDDLPTITDWSVAPDENNPFYANYKWASADEDLWYGFIIQDYETIEHQYKNAVLHLPLNDEMPDGDLLEDNIFQLIKFERKISGAYSETNITSGQFSDSFEGLAGHCKKFGDVDNTFMYINNSSGTVFTPPKEEMAVVLHFTPDNAPSSTEYLLRYGDSWGIYLDSSGYINAWIRPNSLGTSSGGTNGDTIYLKSTSLPSFEGIPTCVIFTIDVALGTGNVKLFIDGKLEDQSGRKTPSGSPNNWPRDYTIPNNEALFIGSNQTLSGSWPSQTVANEFDGKMEEIVIYNKVIYPVVPTDGQFTIFKAFEELSTGTYGSGRSVVARLFIKDYHNIRGKSSSQVGCTAPVAWKKSGIGIDTANP